MLCTGEEEGGANVKQACKQKVVTSQGLLLYYHAWCGAHLGYTSCFLIRLVTVFSFVLQSIESYPKSMDNDLLLTTCKIMDVS